MAHILVVDDDDAVRDVMERMLRHAGHDVVGVNNGEDGLEQLRRQEFDLVVMDVVMPERGGIETIMDMRQVHPKQRTLIVSGKVELSSETFRNLAETMGATASLSKPFSHEQFLEAVRRALGG